MSTYTKTTWIDGSAPAINANNLNKIENQLEQNTNDISNIKRDLDLFNDTSGSNWQDMMKNKIDYCISNINTAKGNVETFINGGWNGVNYGFGAFSKIGTTYQLVWTSSNATYYCRKLGNGTYQYTDIYGKNMIMMHLATKQSFSNSYAKVNLTAKTTIGTKLSVSSNQVKIGAGVNHIKVSGTFGYDYKNAGLRYLRITKNFNTSNIDGTTIAMQLNYETTANHAGTLAITDVVIPVSEGDLIGMYVYGLNGDSARNTASNDMLQTYMTVEVVD